MEISCILEHCAPSQTAHCGLVKSTGIMISSFRRWCLSNITKITPLSLPPVLSQVKTKKGRFRQFPTDMTAVQVKDLSNNQSRGQSLHIRLFMSGVGCHCLLSDGYSDSGSPRSGTSTHSVSSFMSGRFLKLIIYSLTELQSHKNLN